MAFRSRPILDRRHRPRWQDELRTQRLVVAGFAVAIAVAIGIFGATLWNRYYDGQLRPVAAVAASTFDRADLALRERILTAEQIAELTDLQTQVVGGANDTLIEQEIQTVQAELSEVTTSAADSLVQGAVLREHAGELGIGVAEETVDAEWEERRTLPERVHLNLILVRAEAAPGEEGAEEGEEGELSEEDFARARAEAQAALDRVNGGESFEAVAREVSDHFSSENGGDLGVVEVTNSAYAAYIAAVAEADDGDAVGPVEVGDGWAVVRLEERRETSPNQPLIDALAAAGIADGAFRDYLREGLLHEAFRTHFEQRVAVSPQPQRRIAQIYIAADAGGNVPMRRARHVLVEPLPDADDQTAATEEQWQAALTEAQELREQLSAPDADWFTIAQENSDDTGSAARGGDLGWFDPETAPFVPEFNTALAELEEGEVSEPVRTQFGYHVIQVTGEREGAAQQAQEVAEQVADDPDAFGEVARQVSEHAESAVTDGELGWVAPYELAPQLEDAIFALEEVDAVSDVVEVPGDGYYIVKLLEISESREVEPERLSTIRTQGFDRWLAGLRDRLDIWIDPEFAAAETATGP
jgi:parvulin-like peptidyl-prolyl isomerase